ncbi:MAG: cell division protein ZapE [Sinobacteraceae bacterium]|nr:cell division protein ZapE [Nevskiaceae bacterium]MCP5360491.1 cell division protein ZapE [Nevskiaceae bacterium]MCP5472837.1 cell division protein ZapE [Nevskiaceae bacterium]
MPAIYARELAQRGFRHDPAQMAAVAELERVRRELARSDGKASATTKLLTRLAGRRPRHAAPIRGAYLWGGVGRGKTWLMDLFFQHLPIAQKRRSHFHRFMHEVHERLRSLRDRTDPLADVAESIADSSRVLCFDELYVDDIGDAMILGGLFRHLLERQVTLVFTSNVPPSGLYRDGLQRARFLPAIALLEQHTAIVRVDGNTDYRLRHLTQAPIYLSLTASDTDVRLSAIFADLADGPGEATGELEIEGRHVPFVRESENVAWFDFAALCDGPRGKDDYIWLAREYQAVIVAGVPLFDETRENQARRFIAMVDEFYDRGVKLVLSAAAPPDGLYQGQRLRFEFQRTASRLIEMQSEEYLAREHLG